jgi:hypothetical protein
MREEDPVRIEDLSILEVRILKHLYCQNPHRDYTDLKERFRFDHGLECIACDGMLMRLYLTGIKSGSDLYRRIDQGLCIQGGTLNFILSQLKAPKMVPDTRADMPPAFEHAFKDAIHNLIHRGMLKGFANGHEIAEGEDGFRAPVPAPWDPEKEGSPVVGVSMTQHGFETARDLFLQLAEAGD